MLQHCPWPAPPQNDFTNLSLVSQLRPSFSLITALSQFLSFPSPSGASPVSGGRRHDTQTDRLHLHTNPLTTTSCT